MKILQINKFLYPHQGGIESVSESIIEAVKNTKIELHNICFTNTKAFEERKNIKRFYSKHTFFSQPISFKYAFFILKNLKKYDACVVHFPNVLALLPLLFVKHKKIFIYWHSDIRQQSFFLRKTFFLLEKMLIAKAKLIIFATSEHRSGSIHNFKKINSQIIPYTLNNEDISFKTYEYRISNNIPKKTLVFIGRLVEYKGIPYLINAIKTIDANLLIVGAGPLDAELREMSRNISNVKFLGRVDDLEDVYKKASLLVLPSINAAEMFGVVQIEAFARGIPVISTRIKNSGVSIVNRDNITGYICEPSCHESLNECINKFLTNNQQFKSEIIRDVYNANYSNITFKQNFLEILN